LHRVAFFSICCIKYAPEYNVEIRRMRYLGGLNDFESRSKKVGN